MADTRESSVVGALEASASALARIDPGRLGALALLRRVETKFLLPARLVPDLLPAMGAHYGLAPDASRVLGAYRSLYFDTPELAFYLQHHRGQRPRHKVRLRQHLDRSLCFLELKCKTNRDEIVKTRWPRPPADETLSEADRATLGPLVGLDPARLAPRLDLSFSRIALFGLAVPERITIDLDLRAEGEGRQLALTGLAIAEVKQAHFSARSPAMSILREQGLRPRSFSKYCMAQAGLRPDLRQNRFRESHQAIRRLAHA